MDKKEVLKIVDHTLLGVTSTWEDMKQILDDAMKYEKHQLVFQLLT